MRVCSGSFIVRCLRLCTYNIPVKCLTQATVKQTASLKMLALMMVLSGEDGEESHADIQSTDKKEREDLSFPEMDIFASIMVAGGDHDASPPAPGSLRTKRPESLSFFGSETMTADLKWLPSEEQQLVLADAQAVPQLFANTPTPTKMADKARKRPAAAIENATPGKVLKSSLRSRIYSTAYHTAKKSVMQLLSSPEAAKTAAKIAGQQAVDKATKDGVL